VLGGLFQCFAAAVLVAGLRQPAAPGGIVFGGTLLAFSTFYLGAFLAQRTRARNHGAKLGYVLALLGLVGWLITFRLSQRPCHDPNPAL
jgi:hypothetical protein